MNKMEDAACQACGKIRAKIERPVFFNAACKINAGIFFSGRELDVRVGLIVSKHDVELRAILLDEIVFESESLSFVADEDGFEIGDFARERAGLCVNPARFEKIGTHAAAERRGFADVEDDAGGVFEQVDTGAFGKQRGYFSGFHGSAARNLCLSANLHHTRIVKSGW